MSVGMRDHATVTSDGESLAPVIDGVRTRTTVNHVDHRGSVFEIFEGENDVDAFWSEPIVYCYQFSVRPHLMKGWGMHEHKDDRYTVVSGEVLVLLWDARTDSLTHNVVQRVVMSDRAVRQLLIPAGVWHLNVNLGDVEAHLVNFPTQAYHHGAPDRLLLAWDDPTVPVRVADLLPKF